MRDLVATQPTAPAVREGVPWEEVLLVYLDRLNAVGTRRVYSIAVTEAFEWMGIANVNQVAPGDLAGYRAHLVGRAQQKDGDGKLSPASVALKLSALRGFFAFCRLTGVTGMTREVIHFTLASYSSTVVKPYQVLSAEEQEELLEHLREVDASERDYALVKVMLATGLRAAEGCRLQVQDILVDEDGDWSLRVRQGKGRKDRLVPLADGVKKTLRMWLDITGREVGRPDDAGDYIFYGQGGPRTPLTTRRLQQVVKEAARGAGIADKAITPHSLRHTAAMSWLRAGADLVTVQKLLGHANVGTTQRYLDHLGYEELKQWAREL